MHLSTLTNSTTRSMTVYNPQFAPSSKANPTKVRTRQATQSRSKVAKEVEDLDNGLRGAMSE